MSIAIIGAAAVPALAIAGVGIAAYQGCKLAYRGAVYFAEGMERQTAKLDVALGEAQKFDCLSTNEFTAHFLAELAAAQEIASPEVARVAAFRRNELGDFLSEKEWHTVGESQTTDAQVCAVLDQARNRLMNAQAKATISIVEAAAATVGFPTKDAVKSKHARHYFTMKGPRGKAIKTIVQATPDGAKLDLDLHGFSGSACAVVEEQLLKELKQRGLELRDMKIIRHQSPLGLPKIVSRKPATQKKAKQAAQQEQLQKVVA